MFVLGIKRGGTARHAIDVSDNWPIEAQTTTPKGQSCKQFQLIDSNTLSFGLLSPHKRLI